LRRKEFRLKLNNKKIVLEIRKITDIFIIKYIKFGFFCNFLLDATSIY